MLQDLDQTIIYNLCLALLLLQEAGIPPWWRDDIPLLYHDGALVAVADLWLCDGSWLVRDGGKDVWRVRWRRNTDARAIEL